MLADDSYAIHKMDLSLVAQYVDGCFDEGHGDGEFVDST